ncbi:MAG TPA: methyltransferase domain-containing protein [Puia sp.]|nr:methyltransferase domain-containing protein [Puia sp.]
MKFTGEFFIPHDIENENADNPELEIEHKQRYLSMLPMVEGKTVLDIASGEGYGTNILSSSARQAYGVDINRDLVQHAARKYNQENISFLHGSVEAIPLESHCIDIVVSFETLEHVSADTQIQFIAEVRRVLKPGGAFIVSTPNRKNYTDRYNHQNKFHQHELYEDDFKKLLGEHFGHVRIYNQGHEVTSVIMNQDDYHSRSPLNLIPVNGAYHFEGKYLIGLCSDQPQAIQTSISSIVPESEKSYFQLIDRILALQQEVEELGSWGKRSSAEVEKLLQERSAAETILQEKSVTIQALAQERHRALESLEQAEEKIRFYTDASRKLYEDLARSNHKVFLLEAEQEAAQQKNVNSSYSFGLEEFTSEITRLKDAISGRVAKNQPQPLPAKSPHFMAEASLDQQRKEQISKLENDVLWYRKTYEERSLLGVLKQKIAAKFRK